MSLGLKSRAKTSLKLTKDSAISRKFLSLTRHRAHGYAFSFHCVLTLQEGKALKVPRESPPLVIRYPVTNKSFVK